GARVIREIRELLRSASPRDGDGGGAGTGHGRADVDALLPIVKHDDHALPPADAAPLQAGREAIDPLVQLPPRRDLALPNERWLARRVLGVHAIEPGGVLRAPGKDANEGEQARPRELPDEAALAGEPRRDLDGLRRLANPLRKRARALDEVIPHARNLSVI